VSDPLPPAQCILYITGRKVSEGTSVSQVASVILGLAPQNRLAAFLQDPPGRGGRRFGTAGAKAAEDSDAASQRGRGMALVIKCWAMAILCFAQGCLHWERGNSYRRASGNEDGGPVTNGAKAIAARRGCLRRLCPK
jgi:hypothetical protein